MIATRGLLVEVQLLPALDPAGADRRELAEHAIAVVTEARLPVVTTHPRRPQVPASPICHLQPLRSVVPGCGERDLVPRGTPVR